MSCGAAGLSVQGMHWATDGQTIAKLYGYVNSEAIDLWQNKTALRAVMGLL